MTLQEFIDLWQAQPFRAFRLRTTRDAYPVNHPLGAVLTPAMQVAVVVDDTRAITLPLDDIIGTEVYGPPRSPADAIQAVSPETLARHAQLLTQAIEPKTPSPAKTRKPAFDPGKVTFQTSRDDRGILVVHAAVADRSGRPLFTTAGTRWNLHGVERFENGTSLYVHHQDHPREEQRILIWPPDRGSFDSFGEGVPLAELRRELERRDARLGAKPARAFAPPAAWFRAVMPSYPVGEGDGREDAFGVDPTDDPLDRFELHLVKGPRVGARIVRNPCLVDVPAETFPFNLTGTEWDATFVRNRETYELTLTHPRHDRAAIKVTIDPRRLTGNVEGGRPKIPLGFLERTFLNFPLHEDWSALLAALQSGSTPLRQPEAITSPIPGYTVEYWAGESRFPLPFLHPRVVTDDGEVLLDLRASTWAGTIRFKSHAPVATLRLISHEPQRRHSAERLALQLDLSTRRVTAAGLKGSTTLGRLQSLLHATRGLKSLGEDLAGCLAKGKLIPMAG